MLKTRKRVRPQLSATGRVTRAIVSLAGASVALLALGPAASAQQMQRQVDAEWCRGDRWDEDDEDRYCEVRSVTIAATSSLDVDARPNGGIDVEAWDRNEIRIEAKVQTRTRRAGAARAFADQIDVVVEPGRIDSEGPPIRGRGNGWSVSYRLKVPRRIDLDLRSVNGGIAVAGVDGSIDLRTINGGLSIHGASGDVRGRSTNGGITATLAGSRWQGEGLDLETTNGGVLLEVPAGYSAHLETATTNGGYEIDFPVTVQGPVDQRRLSVDVGDGGSTIRAVTTNGGVSVRRL